MPDAPAASAPPAPLPPGAVLGILGGGQLGRLLALDAHRMGLKTAVYCQREAEPAAQVAGRTVLGPWDDEAALGRFAGMCDAVTLEFENVPLAACRAVSRSGPALRPSARSLEATQDRLTEKQTLQAAGLETAPWRDVPDLAALEAAAGEMGGPSILKRRRFGYDGKGQFALDGPEDARAAWDALAAGGAPCLLEGRVEFACEISAIVARGADGAAAVFDVPRNHHQGGILRRSEAPARVSREAVRAAQDGALRLAERLGHVGVLALEYFLLPDGRLVANEFAPRVHNSGHWTVEACRTGQFEQHVRAVAGWPLGDPARHSAAAMDNFIGAEAAPDPSRLEPGDHLTWYGKREARPGRKMGHLTRIMAD